MNNGNVHITEHALESFLEVANMENLEEAQAKELLLDCWKRGKVLKEFQTTWENRYLMSDFQGCSEHRIYKNFLISNIDGSIVTVKFSR